MMPDIIDEFFPNPAEYDLTTHNGLALYSAHMDLYPIKILIKYTDDTLTKTNSFYGELSRKCYAMGDEIDGCHAGTIQTIIANKIASLSYESNLLVLMSTLEEAFSVWRRILQSKVDDAPEFDPKEFSSSRIERDIDYISQYGNIKGIKSYKNWNKIRMFFLARHAIVHNGGFVSKQSDREELEQRGIGTYEENGHVYIDFPTLTMIYDTILEFVDYAFTIQPSEQAEASS